MLEKLGAVALADDGGLSKMRPNYTYLPFNGTLKQIAQGMQGTVIIVMVIAFILAVAFWVMGRFGSSGPMQRIGWGAMIVCLVGAALTAGAGVAISWATGINVFSTAAGGIAGVAPLTVLS